MLLKRQTSMMRSQSSFSIVQRIYKSIKSTVCRLIHVARIWRGSLTLMLAMVESLSFCLLLATIGEVYGGRGSTGESRPKWQRGFPAMVWSWQCFKTKVLNVRSRRYWEDSQSQETILPVEGEINNSPGVGRFERLTNDAYKYTRLLVSDSNRQVTWLCHHSILSIKQASSLWINQRKWKGHVDILHAS